MTAVAASDPGGRETRQAIMEPPPIRRTATAPRSAREQSLDPDDWSAFADLTHRAVDDMLDYLRRVGERPAWQPIPDEVKRRLSSPVPEEGSPLEAVLEEFRRDVLPYPTGNIHPRFWSWVGGTGSPAGVLADLLASAMNSCNLGFDEAAPTYVELQVLDWLRELLGFPADAGGLLVSGGSMANLVGIAAGRVARAAHDVRLEGAVATGSPRLVVYGSTACHSSVQKAVELLGVGSRYYRRIPTNDVHEIDIERLLVQIAEDREEGLLPAVLVANAGTVDIGAVDPLAGLADLAAAEGLWLHVDGAFGAMAALVDGFHPGLDGLSRADSLAFDLHKWLYQPYDIGCVLVSPRRDLAATFSVTAPYLAKVEGGLASGPTDFSALGVQLSRSFRALRPWLSFKAFGVGRFRELIAQNLGQARYLSELVDRSAKLERLAPTALNIVNYRYSSPALDRETTNTLNRRLLVRLHEDGIATPSSTVLDGRFSIRVAIANHRSRRSDFELLVESSARIGDELLAAL